MFCQFFWLAFTSFYVYVLLTECFIRKNCKELFEYWSTPGIFKKHQEIKHDDVLNDVLIEKKNSFEAISESRCAVMFYQIFATINRMWKFKVFQDLFDSNTFIIFSNQVLRRMQIQVSNNRNTISILNKVFGKHFNGFRCLQTNQLTFSNFYHCIKLGLYIQMLFLLQFFVVFSFVYYCIFLSLLCSAPIIHFIFFCFWVFIHLLLRNFFYVLKGIIPYIYILVSLVYF